MSRSEPIVSVSGMRGVVGKELRPETVVCYVAAACHILPPGEVVVGRDSRPSGRIFYHAVLAALAACGRKAIDIGIVPTPTIGVVVRRSGAAGGVQITGSHNPPEQNGIKILDAEGKMLPAEQAQELVQVFRQCRFAYATSAEGAGSHVANRLAGLWHLSAVLDLVDVEAIRRRRFRVLLDANGGAGGPLAQRLLKHLGCEVVGLYLDADGCFYHPPEPLAENLLSVGEIVAASQVDAGFVLDPDADRLGVFDSCGKFLGEEYTLSLCLHHVLRKRRGPIVINCATSLMNEWIAAQFGVPCFRVPVGEANVVRGMREHGAIFGGEGNGGPIDPRVGWIRDSLVGIALILEAMATENASVRELADQLPRFAMRKLKVSLASADFAEKTERLIRMFPTARVDLSDGLRLAWDDRWLLCRPSNTEPVVRVIAEGPSDQVVDDLCSQALATLSADS
ncbi:MAG: phosphoglucosamine mutase [Thermoguttaceae bacterium]|nr:phosphoglucosamine mutase [Thermoguttaceae bacterium]MDW8079110.1 phosphoglucosamine mutase [Thermoguttaceae bacterium]